MLNAETIKGNQRRAALMCIVGYGTSEACPIEAQFVCEECSVRCCISHFEHSEHSSHSGQVNLLKLFIIAHLIINYIISLY